MRPGKLIRTLKKAGVVPLVAAMLVASSASAYSLFTCRDGISRSECCCPQSKLARPSAEQATVSAGCCTVTDHQVDAQPFEASRPRVEAPPAQPVLVAWAPVEQLPLLSRVWPVRLLEKPGARPPILLQTSSFLI